MYMSKINETYSVAMSMVMVRMIQNWTGTQKDLEKEAKILVDIIYEDGQNSVKRDR